MKVYGCAVIHGELVIQSCEAKVTAKQIMLSKYLDAFWHRRRFDRDALLLFATSEQEALDQFIKRQVTQATKLRQKLKRVQLNIEAARKRRELCSYSK